MSLTDELKSDDYIPVRLPKELTDEIEDVIRR
jgi:hypothetical protein